MAVDSEELGSAGESSSGREGAVEVEKDPGPVYKILAGETLCPWSTRQVEGMAREYVPGVHGCVLPTPQLPISLPPAILGKWALTPALQLAASDPGPVQDPGSLRPLQSLLWHVLTRQASPLASVPPHSVPDRPPSAVHT
jgi:hypothetical protein